MIAMAEYARLLGYPPGKSLEGAVLVSVNDFDKGAALKIARDLRQAGFRADLDGRGNSIKSMLRRADGSGARWCVVLGDAEVDRGVVQLKDLAQHTQEDVPRAALVERVSTAARADNEGAA